MALRVLLADNSETIKKVIQLTLQEFQLDLRVVTLGVDVLDVATQFKPDIIFVDILLQKKSGYDVAKELKHNVHTKNIPLILMWSGFMEFDEAKAKESLADARLEKPFDSDTLKNLVTKLVKKPEEKAASNDVNSFLDFPTPKATMPTSTPKSAKNEDPLKSLENIQREAEMFNPEKIKPVSKESLQNDVPAQDFTENNSSKEESVDEFEMQPLDKTTGFGYRKTDAPNVDHGSISQKTKSFVLNLPDDASSGGDIPLDLENIENVEDMSFLLNPESVVGPNPLKQELNQTNKDNAEVTKVSEQATKILPPQPKAETSAKGSSSAPPAIPTTQDIEKIVRQEVREAIEKAVWQVVPEMASQMIKKELDRLLNDSSNEEKK